MKREYFKSGELLIAHNINKNMYVVVNQKEPFIITQKEFENFKPIQIKNVVFHRELNKYFHNIREEWEFEGNRFRNLECFDCEGFSNEINIHTMPSTNNILFKHMITVYHCGKIYYGMIDKSKRRMGLQLFDIKEEKFVKRTSVTNCCPIFNINLKTVI